MHIGLPADEICYLMNLAAREVKLEKNASAFFDMPNLMAHEVRAENAEGSSDPKQENASYLKDEAEGFEKSLLLKVIRLETGEW